MPNNGINDSCLIHEYMLQSNATPSSSGAGTATYGHSAVAYTNWVPDVIQTLLGIKLTTQSSFDGTTGSWSATYDGPGAPFGGYVVSGSGYRSSVSITIRLNNRKLYSKLTGSLWRVVWDSIDVYVNGVFSVTLTGGMDLTSSGVGPNYIPIIATPLYISGGVFGGRVGVSIPAHDPCNPGAGFPIAWETDVSGSVSGGSRTKDGSGAWRQSPVLVYKKAAPTGVGCPFGLGFGAVSATTTYDASIESRSKQGYKKEYVEREIADVTVFALCGGTLETGPSVVAIGTGPGECVDPCNPSGPLIEAQRDVYKVTTYGESSGGAIAPLGNHEKAIKRFNKTYLAAWHRRMFPQVEASVGRSCVNGIVSSNTTDTPVVYPFLPEKRDTVRYDVSDLEIPFTVETYSPTQESKNRYYTETYEYYGTGPCQCPPSWVDTSVDPCGSEFSYRCTPNWKTREEVNKHESISLTFPSAVGPLGDYQQHANPLMRYYASWPCPHWHFSYVSYPWNLEGSPVNYQDYWQPTRELYDFHPAGSTNTRLRYSCVSSPMAESGHTPFTDNFFDGEDWIGVGRWQTVEYTLPSEFVYTSSSAPLWTGDIHTTITHGANLQLASADGTSVLTADLDLGSWTEDEKQRPHLADKFVLAWSTTNVANVKVQLVGVDGEVADITNNVQGTFAKPVGKQLKYGQSQAIDNGYGVISDAGEDAKPPGPTPPRGSDGISSTIMSDPETVYAMSLLRTRTAKALRFIVTLTNPALPATITYPKIKYPTKVPALVVENSKVQLLLWENGPGVRFGQWTWYTPSGLTNPPLITAMGINNSIIDMLCFGRIALQGVPYNGGTPNLPTQLTYLFDTYEGQSVGVVDKFSNSFLLPFKSGDTTIRGALVNSFSEVPPLAVFPHPTRNDTWGLTSTYGQVMWDWCEPNRNHVHPATTHTFDIQKASASWADGVLSLPNGWIGVYHTKSVNNDEGVTLALTIDNEIFAEVSCYHGSLSSLIVGEDDSDSGDGLWHIQTKENRMYAVNVQSGKVVCRSSMFGVPQTGFYITTTLPTHSSCANPCIGFYRSSRQLTILYEKTDTKNIWSTVSFDEGRTWSTPELLVSNAYRPFIATAKDGLTVVQGYATYISGTSGPMHIWLRKADVGTSWSSWSRAVDYDTGAFLVAEDGKIGNIANAKNETDNWTLTFVVNGESAPSVWASVNMKDFIFKRVI